MEIKLIHNGFIVIVPWLWLIFVFIICGAMVAFFGYVIGKTYLHKRKWCCDRCEDVLPPIRMWGRGHDYESPSPPPEDYIIVPVMIEGGKKSGIFPAS